MRRKANTLLPIELSIIEAGILLRNEGATHFHGFLIAKEIKEREAGRLLTAHGTLYKALDRMAKASLLERWWEDPLIAAEEHRPRRCFYEVTVAGERALANSGRVNPEGLMKLETGGATP